MLYKRSIRNTIIISSLTKMAGCGCSLCEPIHRGCECEGCRGKGAHQTSTGVLFLTEVDEEKGGRNEVRVTPIVPQNTYRMMVNPHENDLFHVVPASTGLPTTTHPTPSPSEEPALVKPPSPTPNAPAEDLRTPLEDITHLLSTKP